jgi:phosphoesterase RecJ-like protein
MIGAAEVERFRRAIDDVRAIVLVSHLNPDGDAIGSELGLARFFASRGTSVRIVNQDPAPESLDFLDTDGFALEVYEPGRHDELFATVDRIVLVDNSAPDRLGRLERPLLENAGRTLCIDHHPTRDAPWGESIVDEDASSTTAMIYELLQACGFTPAAAGAQALYVGLATDTGFFRFNSTSPRAHEIAADLLRLGVDPASIYQRLHERNAERYLRLLGHALAGLRVDGGGRIASVEIPRTLVATLGAETVDPTDILNVLLTLDHVKVALLFRELGDGRVKVSLRSKGSLDVHHLASEFGGGGHRNASGIVLAQPLGETVRLVVARASALLEQEG